MDVVGDSPDQLVIRLGERLQCQVSTISLRGTNAKDSPDQEQVEQLGEETSALCIDTDYASRSDSSKVWYAEAHSWTPVSIYGGVQRSETSTKS